MHSLACPHTDHGGAPQQYGSYHAHPTNIKIHIIFVPILMFVMMSMGANVPLPLPLVPLDYANLSTAVAAVYSVGYVLLSPLPGAILAPYVLAQALVGSYSVHHVDGFNRYAAAVQVVSWVSQFIGHGVYEGRAPALLDNIMQALFLAPLFVWIEVLFMLGWNQELKHRLDGQIAQKRKEMDLAKKKKAEGKEL